MPRAALRADQFPQGRGRVIRVELGEQFTITQTALCGCVDVMGERVYSFVPRGTLSFVYMLDI